MRVRHRVGSFPRYWQISPFTPSLKASKVHQEEIGRIIRKHRCAPQAALIKHLNPVIRGWASYYANSDAQSVGVLTKQDNLAYLKLRTWGKRRCESINSGHIKYWTSIGSNNWVFATKNGDDPLRLLKHSEFGSSSTSYVKVNGDKSPYDGDTVYWSSRLLKNLEMLVVRLSCSRKKRVNARSANYTFFRNGMY
ncbi:group II intron maturase-specific domain-containing protein [Microcoleus sp. AT3-D2]|uniref:group II intron maturase-specific domain-containing protein n=1 Tax=Microcoleus sp. AT3-D2 TaxID=2818612 RepID=UPI002FD66435